MPLRKGPSFDDEKWELEDGLDTSSVLGSPTESDALTGRRNGRNNNLDYLIDPFTQINQTKDALQKLVTVHVVKKQMKFSDDVFERKFVNYVEGRLRSRMLLLGIGAMGYGCYSLFFYNFFGKQDPLLYCWGTWANALYNISWINVVVMGLCTVVVSLKKNIFRHSVERYLQYSTLVVLVSGLLFGNLWRVSRVTGIPFYVAFPGMKDTYPDSDLVMLLGAIVLYLAVVADMRFRRLIWIVCLSFIIYAVTVLFFKLPDFNQGHPEDVVDVPQSDDVMQTYMLALQLFALYAIGLFGKVQLELLQRHNFLELELAAKRIDVLEKTINAIDSDNQPHTQLEQTHKRLKDAERIIEKVKLVGMSNREEGSTVAGLYLGELQIVLEVLQETEKAMTILDFQKQILLGPMKTGHEYKEEEVMDWIQTITTTNDKHEDAVVGRVNVPLNPFLEELDLGISAKSLMKRIGVEWKLSLAEMERSLTENRASGLSAFQLAARALLAPYRNNVLLGIAPEVLHGFARAVDDAYLGVPYHNAYHAADVAHHATILLEDLVGLRTHLSGLDCLALTVAALCHCVSHFGRTNAFLIETRHDLATRYNDASVLENFHAYKTFELIRSSKLTNITATMSRRDERRFRSRVIQLILATDQGLHFQHFSELRMRLMGAQMFVDPAMVEADRRIGLTAIIKAADLGHHTMPLEIHTQWIQNLADEYAQQGDDERALGLSLSPMCDRDTQEVASMAAGLMNLVVMPYYDEIFNMVKKLNPGLAESKMSLICSNLVSNHAHWVATRRKVKAAGSDKASSRGHADSFDIFVPMPKERTITTTFDSAPDLPKSPPNLIPLSRHLSVSPTSLPERITLTVESYDSEDDEPPVLPFKQAYK